MFFFLPFFLFSFFKENQLFGVFFFDEQLFGVKTFSQAISNDIFLKKGLIFIFTIQKIHNFYYFFLFKKKQSYFKLKTWIFFLLYV
jgi:hypothetical protein